MDTHAKNIRSSPLWNILKIVLALILAAYVLSRTELDHLAGLGRRVDVTWVALVFVLYLALTLLKSLQYYFMIGREADYPQVLNIVVIQNAASNFVANSAGLASYLALFRVEQGVKLSRAGMVFLLAKVWDLVSVWLFLLACSLLFWPQVGVLQGLTLVLLAVIGAVILGFFLAVGMRHRFISLLHAFLDRTRLGRIALVGKTAGILETLAGQEQGFSLAMIGIGNLYSAVRLAVTLAWLYASLRAFSFQVDLLPVVFVNLLMQLVSYLPFQVFGGLGVTETTSLYFYGFFDLPQTELAAVLIGHRLLFYATNLFMLLYLPLHALLFNRPVE